jgi:hypothetical protein
MALGEKVAEEKGSIIGMSIKSIDANGMSIEFSFASEITGIGRFPSGRNVGTFSGLDGPHTNRSTGQGVVFTKDGEMLPWHGSGIDKRVGDKIKGAFLVTFTTMSQKYAWMNDLLIVLDSQASADMTQFSDTAYEWK